MECVTCGGLDFIKDSGFFYCTECQTQSQEIREHVFQEDNINIKSAKKIRKPKSEKPENKVTSWECYNIIMCSLTKELIKLGADKKLKVVSKYLWLRYMEKIEVFNVESDGKIGKPKLPAINLKRDVNILYNQKKRKRKRSISEVSSDATSVSFKRERTKRKRALAQAQYDELSATQDSGLMNESLTSLKGTSDESEAESLNFNRYSRKELRKRMSKEHLKEHCADTALNLKCHKLIYKDSSKKYRTGVEFLSPIKMYSILYLGLLIIKDKIQLGDLLRFIREGHLTFNNYTKLLPESFEAKMLGITNNNKNDGFTAKTLRTTAAKLVFFLDITNYIEVPDLTELCKRYCKELNLPNEIFLAVQNVLSTTTPKLIMNETNITIPNYEGRCLSLILFILKLFFGLDGVTEFHLSKYAKLLNNGNTNPKMFDIQEWLEYIGYRSLVISENHFPTSYSNGAEVDSDLFLQYFKSHNISFDDNVKLTKEMEDYKQILTKLVEAQHDYITFVEFPASLTPFLSYSKIIAKSYRNKYSTQLLNRNFVKDSIDFLLYPDNYFNRMNKKIEIKSGGANNNFIWTEVQNCRRRKNQSRKNFNLVPLEIMNSRNKDNMSDDSDDLDHKRKKKKSHKLKEKSSFFLQQQENHKNNFKTNEEIISSISDKILLDNVEIKSSDLYKIHYQPYESYWMNFHMNIDTMTACEFEIFFNKYPFTFRKIFNECSRMIEVNSQDLFHEFQSTELFLVNAAHFLKKKKLKVGCVNKNLIYYISLAEYTW